MPSNLNISLTDELRSFVDSNTGEGTTYATPSEFVRALLRDKKLKQEAEELRQGIIEGYQDAIAGRTITFTGDLEDALIEFEKKEREGWE